MKYPGALSGTGPVLIFHPRVAIKASDMQCDEIEKPMDELAWKYVETHDRDIIEELND